VGTANADRTRGERTYISDLALDADPQAVAEWIANTAHKQQCPAAVDADMRRRNAIVAASHPTRTDHTATLADPRGVTTPAPQQEHGTSR
jgi:hypothetical protein